jgi:membrane protein YqaA with SNARE-associated domain
MEALAPDEDVRPELYRTTVTSLLRLALAFGLFAGALALVAWRFRDELERAGSWFVAHFGVVGMASGTFLADAFQFPLPPQFWLLTAITGGGSQIAAVTAVIAGSVLGGFTAFSIGKKLSGVGFLERSSRAPRRLLQQILDRHGWRGLVVAGLMPLSYWLLCSAGGVLRLPYRAYGVLALMRIPRLILTYTLARMVWS